MSQFEINGKTFHFLDAKLVLEKAVKLKNRFERFKQAQTSGEKTKGLIVVDTGDGYFFMNVVGGGRVDVEEKPLSGEMETIIEFGADFLENRTIESFAFLISRLGLEYVYPELRNIDNFELDKAIMSHVGYIRGSAASK